MAESNDKRANDSNVYNYPEGTRYFDQAQSFDQLKSGGGGGNSGGMTTDWKESVDRQLTRLHDDVRHLLFGGIAAVLLIFGAGWAGYVKLADQIADFRISQAQSSEKLTAMDERLKQSDAKLDRIVEKLDAAKGN